MKQLVPSEVGMNSKVRGVDDSDKLWYWKQDHAGIMELSPKINA